MIHKLFNSHALKHITTRKSLTSIITIHNDTIYISIGYQISTYYRSKLHYPILNYKVYFSPSTKFTYRITSRPIPLSYYIRYLSLSYTSHILAHYLSLTSDIKNIYFSQYLIKIIIELLQFITLVQISSHLPITVDNYYISITIILLDRNNFYHCTGPKLTCIKLCL